MLKREGYLQEFGAESLQHWRLGGKAGLHCRILRCAFEVMYWESGM